MYSSNGTIRSNRPRNQIRGTARELVCFKCNQPGHWAGNVIVTRARTSNKSPNSTVKSSRSNNEGEKLSNERTRDDKKMQVDNNIEVVLYNKSKVRPASSLLIPHKAVRQNCVMHKAPEAEVERKHKNSIENGIEMFSKAYTDIALAHERINNEYREEEAMNVFPGESTPEAKKLKGVSTTLGIVKLDVDQCLLVIGFVVPSPREQSSSRDERTRFDKTTPLGNRSNSSVHRFGIKSNL
ncbi:hypothetical protein EVAR_64386_1 [Eumeta japonica]|uniref:CCHC-type domain-containing protein n=1 Tax=Eumeta variegata TaxID=151549 RepID=A0A4C1SFQ9_EUMVA|nr:hypothetical protein EVAR_64386_1 [Eumeta japonica]